MALNYNEDRINRALTALRANCIDADHHDALYGRLMDASAHDTDEGCVVELLTNLHPTARSATSISSAR